MKFKKSGQILLALAVSLGLSFGLTSCVNDYTVAYLYVTGSYQNQIGAFKISNNTGNLTPIFKSPFGSGGTDPVRAVVSTTGRYLYVLNAGSPGKPDANGNFTYAGANISVFSVGGSGVLAFQKSYFSQGSGAARFALSPTGNYLYVLDEYSPAAGMDASGNPMINSTTPVAGMSCQDSSGIYHPVGDITVFSVDNNTGRLSLVTNNQLQTPTGAQLPYFPVGCAPIDFKVTGAYILTADTSDPLTGNHFTVFPYSESNTTGQLTTTQNSEFVTGASSISAISSNASGSFIYILDPVNNDIWYYTVGSGGLLQAVTGSPTVNSETTAGNPIQLTSDNKGKFLYVANYGPSTGQSNANSDITAYTIASNGVLAPTAKGVFGTGSGPECIIEDPSNQYLFTANFNSNTVTGQVLDPSSGELTNMRNKSSFPTITNPTWCVADSHTY
ncbi:MAG TPA: beta-propeller fold lactonase family protein [Acidobacteriaceae bacterium]|nr:beta-propeller fold lactonase family protein [Acidobacteriaceae bacterium]